MIGKRRILVTGGCGSIGSALVSRLIDDGWTVDVIDDLSSGSLDNILIENEKLLVSYLGMDVDDLTSNDSVREKKPLHVLIGDCGSPYVLTTIRRGDYDVVAHLAAVSSIPPTIQDPSWSTKINVSTTVEIAHMCAASKKTRLIFASSSAVYGEMRFAVSESSLCEPVSPYGAQKLAAENIIGTIVRFSSLNSVCLRLFNVYGPQQPAKGVGSGVISVWRENVEKGLHVKISTHKDGDVSRDFTHVDDVVQAFILMIEKSSVKRYSGDAFNVGTGVTTTLSDLAHIMCVQLKSISPKIFSGYRQGDVLMTLSDSSKIRSEVDWRSEISLQEGLRRVLSV